MLQSTLYKLTVICCFGLLCPGTLAFAQDSGFQLNRYELTPPGQGSFMVDSPPFSSRFLSVGISLNYAHNPLVLRVSDPTGEVDVTRVLIAHRLLSRLDIARIYGQPGVTPVVIGFGTHVLAAYGRNAKRSSSDAGYQGEQVRPGSTDLIPYQQGRDFGC